MKAEFVKLGNTTIKIIPTLKEGRRYWLVIDKSKGYRRQLNATSLEAAKKKALAIAKLTEAGAKKLVGRDLDAIHREWLEATELLNGKGSLLQAVRFYMSNGGPDLTPKKHKEIVDELVAVKKSQGWSPEHVSNIKARLDRLVSVYGEEDANAMTNAKMDTFIHGLKFAPITKNQYRKTFMNYFTFCQSRGYVAKDFNPAKACGRVSVVHQEVEFFSSAEMNKLIAASTGDLAAALPMLLFCGFAGLRPKEAEQLRWEHVGQDFIRLPASISKTKKSRLIPILPNLQLWLAPLRQTAGPALPVKPRKLTGPLARTSGIVWKDDGLRHSFGTYRHAVIQNIHQLCEELGNSVAVARADYVNPLVTPEEGRAWFDIRPDDMEKVTPLVAHEATL